MSAFISRPVVFIRSAVTSSRALPSPGDRPTICVLPPEILALIVSYLNRSDQMRVTRLSRAFYAAASAAGLCICRAIHFPSDNFVSRVDAFQKICRHAERYGRLVSRVLTDISGSNPDERSPRNTDRLLVKEAVEILASILPMVLALISDLKIHIPLEFMPPLLDALCHEAPRLKSLRLDCRDRGQHSTTGLPSFPTRFLGGHAPNLRHIHLGLIEMGQVPLSVFSGVRRTCLSYLTDFPDIDLGAHFPSAAYVQLELEDFGHGISARIPSLKLSGLSLRFLSVLDDTPAGDTLLRSINRSVSLQSIPEVHVCSMYEPDWATLELTMPSDRRKLALRLVDRSVENLPMIMLSTLDMSWRRAAVVYEGDDLSISQTSGLSFGRLTYLRLNCQLLEALLDCNLVLTLLEHIKVDVAPYSPEPFTLWPWEDAVLNADISESMAFGDAPPDVSVSCPHLALLTLFASYKPMTIDSREVALLGRALAWKSDCRPLLRLVGVDLEEPVADPLLSRVFFLVELTGFAGRDSPEDWDSGLWDYCKRD